MSQPTIPITIQELEKGQRMKEIVQLFEEMEMRRERKLEEDTLREIECVCGTSLLSESGDRVKGCSGGKERRINEKEQQSIKM